MHAVCAICANRAPEQPDRLANGLIWPGPAPAGVRRRVPPRSPPADPGSRAPAVPAATVAGEFAEPEMHIWRAGLAARRAKTRLRASPGLSITASARGHTSRRCAPNVSRCWRSSPSCSPFWPCPRSSEQRPLARSGPSPSRICRQPASRRQRRSRAIGASCEPWPWVLHAVIQPDRASRPTSLPRATSSAIQAGGLDAQTRAG